MHGMCCMCNSSERGCDVYSCDAGFLASALLQCAAGNAWAVDVKVLDYWLFVLKHEERLTVGSFIFVD